MDKKRNTRRYLLVLVAVVVLFVSAAGVVALAQPNEGDVFTGCLNEESGGLRNVAVGFESAKPCNPEELQISWDRAGPAFEGRIAALEERVAELEEQFGTLDLFVDCDAGDTVGDALAEAQTHPGPVTIAISGVCEENVGIGRDDVTLSGLQRGDGIRATSAASTVYISDAHHVRFFNMTITGGTAGIEGGPGSTFSVDGVTVQDASTWGIIASTGSSADLRDCIVENTLDAGVTASGGDVYIQDCLITGGTDGMKSEFGGRIIGFFVDAISNGRFGAVAQAGSAIYLVDSTIADNGLFGIHSVSNSAVTVSGSLIANNGATGAQAGTGGMIDISDSVVEGNGGNGIDAVQASTVVIEKTTIKANTFDGIKLLDQSNGAGSGIGMVISGNGGFGINCAGPPGYPIVQNGFVDITQIQFSGNPDGDTNCP